MYVPQCSPKYGTVAGFDGVLEAATAYVATTADYRSNNYVVNEYVYATFKLAAPTNDISAVRIWPLTTASTIKDAQDLIIWVHSQPYFQTGVVCGNGGATTIAGYNPFMIYCNETLNNATYVTVQHVQSITSNQLQFLEIQVFANGECCRHIYISLE